jgi:hypothetical protein
MKTDILIHVYNKAIAFCAMETLKQFSDKHISMETHGQQYNTTVYNINFELGQTTFDSLGHNTTASYVLMDSYYCPL